MIKNLLILVALLFAIQGQTHEHTCSIQLQSVGIYRTYCPPGTLMDANATRVQHINRSIFVQDQVRCVRPVLVCGKDEEVLDTQEEFEDN